MGMCFIFLFLNLADVAMTMSILLRALSRLLYFLSLGYSCPRKVLINSDIKEIDPPHELSLFNANTPEESEFAVKKLAAIRPSEN